MLILLRFFKQLGLRLAELRITDGIGKTLDRRGIELSGIFTLKRSRDIFMHSAFPATPEKQLNPTSLKTSRTMDRPQHILRLFYK